MTGMIVIRYDRYDSDLIWHNIEELVVLTMLGVRNQLTTERRLVRCYIDVELAAANTQCLSVGWGPTITDSHISRNHLFVVAEITTELPAFTVASLKRRCHATSCMGSI